MQSKLSVSVVIITRNRADLLQDALESLVRQRRPPDEVVVVDNASHDHTRDVVAGFKGMLNVTYVYEPIRGIPRARNAGVNASTGDIIAFIDDDCVADEDWLKYMEIPFIRDPYVGIVGGEVSSFRIGSGIVEEFYIKNMNSGRKSKD